MPVTVSTADLLDACRVVKLPLSVRFRGVNERELVLVEGPYGWGEFGPFVEYDDVESAPWLTAALEAAFEAPVSALRDRVSVNATVPAVDAEQVPGVLARYDGCDTVKIKVAEVGQSLDDDLARVAAVREVLPGAALRVDANGGWTVEQARLALTALAAHGLQYAEQPCRTVPELVSLREHLERDGVAVPLAADESIRKASDPLAVARSGAVDFGVIKVPPLGGVRRVLELASELEAFGMRLVVSSAIDSSVGLAAGVRAAAALPGEPLACGLGTASLLAGDVVADGLRPKAGVLEVRSVVPDEELLQRFAVEGSRRQWWLERVRRCHKLLVGSEE